MFFSTDPTFNNVAKQTADCDQARWFEKNCTVQPGIDMAIWEPCNYVSNLAYDRLVVELCTQTDWVMDLDTLNDIRQSPLLLLVEILPDTVH